MIEPNEASLSPAARDGASQRPASGKQAAALAFRNVTFTYPGQERPVLDGVDWEVERGSFTLLVGSTGSGKSTLLSLAKPEIAPAGERTGEVLVQGILVEDLGAERSARAVGFVFQNPENQIVCESVWHEMAFGLENLATPRAEMRRLVAETSYFFGMEDWFRADTAELSGGRKQLLALASTLVMQPRLLLLDEPTAQLDPIAEKNFLHALFRVNRELGCTVVVATHAPRAMLDYATCAYRLEEGRIARVENLSDLERRWEPGLGHRGRGESSRPTSEEQSPPSPAPEQTPVGRLITPAAASRAVEFSRAWFRYGRDDDWVLHNLDLAVGAGSVHALVGGNGCGKSTLLALMAGLHKLQHGSLRRASRSCVLLPQDPRALFVAETADDELAEWGADAGYGEAEASAMLERVGLAGCGPMHPYDLSGGQQQLLALAKLLLVKPRVLLLDEPTKGLDMAARCAVCELLDEVAAEGATVVVATHDLELVEHLADEVSMIFDGEVASTEPTERFFQGNVYYRP